MRRTALLLTLSTLLLAPSACAQNPDQPSHVYEAFFKVSYADLEEWNRQYFEYSVPILTDMQQSGAIEGWSQWEHHTGGEYNIRFTVRTYGWDAFDSFWAEYLERMEAAVPEDEATPNVVEAHRDEIWNIASVNVAPDLEPTYLYSSTFNISFGDQDEWNRIWSEVAGPILDEAIEEGLLGGWVKLDHNTGGPHNAKILYLYEEWDDIDDLTARLLERMGESAPEDLAGAFAMLRSHDDIIWVPSQPAM